LSRREIERYDRQMMIRGWGHEGQAKLKLASVVVAGLGGLGCPAALYLCAAGVGRIRIIDKERCDLNNLNRQILYWESDVGRYKAELAKEKLERLNSSVTIEAVRDTITDRNATELIQGFNVVVDGLDNFRTRLVLNRACVSKDMPFVHGSIYGLEGYVTTIVPHRTPCLMCIYGEVPSEIEKFPVVGATTATIASLEVMETLKLITGIGMPYSGKLLFWDGADMSFHEIDVQRKPHCPVCGGPGSRETPDSQQQSDGAAPELE
jgi:molybdopterin/thiamine biosynthesis adenylyltransferase